MFFRTETSLHRLIPIIALLVWAFFGGQCKDGNNEIRTGNIRIIEGGQEFPLEIPPEFRYPGSEMVFLSSFEGSSVWTRPETTASIRTEDSLNAVANYYQEVIRTSGWQVIQSRRTSEAVLFMAESGYRNLLTVIIRPELFEARQSREDEIQNEPGSDVSEPAAEVEGPTRIKLYLKQSNSD